jgi:hypothetical protein
MLEVPPITYEIVGALPPIPCPVVVRLENPGKAGRTAGKRALQANGITWAPNEKQEPGPRKKKRTIPEKCRCQALMSAYRRRPAKNIRKIAEKTPEKIA